MRKKLEEGEKDAELSKHLATILVDVPIDIRLEECHLTRAPFEKVKNFLESMEFKNAAEADRHS